MVKQLITDAELAAAEQRGLEATIGEARAVSARYAPDTGLLLIGLRGGITLLVPSARLQGVADAPPNLIEQVEITANGAGLRWPALDANFAVQSIVAGSFGTKKWMRHLEELGQLDAASMERQRLLDRIAGKRAGADLGRKGGSVSTPVKAAAARANGALGGRPRKAAPSQVT